jgi:hypothetical protein
MAVELDHVFICVSRGAPEAEYLVQFGLCEGPANVHPGQGTANRRFFFANSMLELLWVENSAEAQNEVTAPTQLWERWSNRGSGACPFGIITRPVDSESIAVPFPAQEYQPIWLPPELRIYVSPAGVTEPMWLFMPFLRRTDHERRFLGHPSGVREMTGLVLEGPSAPESAAAAALSERGIVRYRQGPDYLLTIELDHSLRGQTTDFRPNLPLVFRI